MLTFRRMYSIDWGTLLSRTHRNCSACPACPHATSTSDRVRVAGRRLPLVGGTVWALGLTSLLTDISSEMVASVLPVYLVLHLGISPLAFGIVDGAYQGVAALVRLASGLLADRWRRHKEIAVLGYGVSALCRPLLLAAGNFWTSILGVVALDRIGKGIRTAPRDALIAERSPCRELSTAFGVHRALDAAGAMLGPVVAFGLLFGLPGRFDVLFLASFGFAVAGVAAIVLFVRGSDPQDKVIAAAPVSVATTARLLGQRRFRALVISGTILGMATISDSFVFLLIQQKLSIAASAFPLLYVATSFFTSLLAVPLGRLADRFGRQSVLLAGYFALGVVYSILLSSGASYFAALAAVVVLGGYYAATDGVLTAMAAAELPAGQSGTGLAVLGTATNTARLTASVLFGWLWMAVGVLAAVEIFMAALIVALFGTMALLHHSRSDGPTPN